MGKDFYTISIYVDKDENLIGIPCGESDKYQIADIDTVLLLKAPYSDSAIEKFVDKIFDACYTKKHNDNSEISTIERYTKKKGFINATKDLTLITIVKTKERYSLMATFNDYEKGPVIIDDDERILMNPYKEGTMAENLKDFIEIYAKANMFYKEIKEAESRKNNQ